MAATSVIDTRVETSHDGASLIIKCDGKEIIISGRHFTPEIQQAAMLHGFKQKIVDAAALSRDPDTGKSATPEQKYHAMQEVVTQLMQGEWNRKGGGDGTAGLGLLVAALMRMSGQDRDQVEATVAGWTKEQQKAMRECGEVAPIIAAIKAERAAKAPAKAAEDVTGLLAGFVKAPVAQEPEGKGTKGKK